MIDVGLIVEREDRTGYRRVSAMLPDESECSEFINVDTGRNMNSFITAVASSYKMPKTDLQEFREHIIERADVADAVAKGSTVEKFTLGELCVKYPALKPPVVDGLFRQGETANIIAATKVGKSWLAYGLGISLAMGEPWLGHFPTTKGRVLLIDNELHRPTIAGRIPLVGTAMGHFLSDYEKNFHVWPLRGKLRTLAELGEEFRKIEPGYYQAIILDAKYRFALAGVSENDNSAEALWYNELDKHAEQLQSAMVLIHHSTKGDQSGKRVTDIGAGAGSQSRAADAHVVLREHEQPGVVALDAAVRSFKPVEPLSLRWEFPLWLPCDVDPTALAGKRTKQEERQSQNDTTGMRDICGVLLDGPATASAIRREVGLGRDRAERLLSMMMKDSQIKTTQTTINGNKCDEYSLYETDEWRG